MHQPRPSQSFAADPSWRIGIVHSSFYPEDMASMVESARGALESAGILKDHIGIFEASGSFEIPLLASALARAKKFDALIALGIIVEGETHHAELLAREVTRGLMEIQLRYALPCAFEVLYVATLDLARKRLTRGGEASRAVLHSLAQLRSIHSEGL